MTANNLRATPGISSALDVPVMQGNKKGESALFQGVAKRTGTPIPMDGAAFCSREETTTVVIGASTCERCATSGKGETGEEVLSSEFEVEQKAEVGESSRFSEL